MGTIDKCRDYLFTSLNIEAMRTGHFSQLKMNFRTKIQKKLPKFKKTTNVQFSTNPLFAIPHNRRKELSHSRESLVGSVTQIVNLTRS